MNLHHHLISNPSTFIVLRDADKFDRELESILKQYTRFVKPAFEDYVLPTKKYADVIIPRGADNKGK